MSVPNEQMSQDLSEIILPDFSAMTVASENLISSVEDNGIAEKIRCVMSASGIAAIMSNPEMDALPESGRQYIQKKFANRTFEGSVAGFKSKATKHGNNNEQPALDAFAKAGGFALSNTGDDQAHLTYGDYVVAHPDALVFKDSVLVATVEVKCPLNQEIFADYLNIRDAQTLKEKSTLYYWQVCCQQLCAGVNSTFFVDFDPRNEESGIHFCEINIPLDDIEFMKHRIKLAEDYLQLLMSEDDSAVPFVESDLPIYEVKQLPKVDLNIELVAVHHHEPEVLVQRIANMAGRFVFDMTTAKGRDACRSHAAQIIKCITPALNASKQLATDAKKVIEKDLRFRKEFESGVREIAEHHRKPLTAWEKEQERIAAEEKAEQERIAAEQERIEREEREAAEYLKEWDAALQENELYDLRREKALRDQEEQARIAEEQRKEREAQAIANAVKAEQERAQREQEEKDRQAQEALEKAERERVAAEQRAEQAAQAERERIEREQAEKERIAREESQRLEHRVKIDDEIVKALESNGFSFDDAVKIIDLASAGKLGRLAINY